MKFIRAFCSVVFVSGLLMGSALADTSIVSPAKGSTLPGSSSTITWQSDLTNVNQWWIRLGSRRGGSDIYDSGRIFDGTRRSVMVNSLPTDGSTVHVQFQYKLPVVPWVTERFTYKAASSSGGSSGGTLAELSCNAGQIAKFGSNEWECAADARGPDHTADIIELFMRVAALEAKHGPLEIGGPGPGGGIVFYLDGSGGGMEAAQFDQSAAAWGCSGTSVGATGTAIGSGQANTNAIISGCNQVSIAAKVAAAVGEGWFLPSKDELNEMYLNIGHGGDGKNEGGFIFSTYWSSSERSDSEAWNQVFNSANQPNFNKINSLGVRAVKGF